ncbi:HEPN domain-containing protein [Mesorhizobium sp. M0199]|uniref:HEPN domain-containing protein n=1 Tax=unclassified Mesorhizobium TaxID=325217 RepID=UPI003339BBF5
MASAFEIIVEDFVEDVEAIRSLVVTFADTKYQPRSRIAAANSATLLVAATFEEFVREMAREFARAVVSGAPSFDKLPTNLASTAWKRTMDGLGKVKFDAQGKRGEMFGIAQAKFSVIYDFCKGDLSKDIYRELIHNETNMHPTQINSLFKVSGLKDVCERCSHKQSLLEIFGETEHGKAHGKLLTGINDFFDRRNDIAHALNGGQSSSPEQIQTDIDMLISFGKALCEVLEGQAPQPFVPAAEVSVEPAPAAAVSTLEAAQNA